MRPARFSPDQLLRPFARKKVLARAELLDACGCSAMTAWRILRRHGYVTSYNRNARYCTLAGIAQFDRQGLWEYRGVRFSKWGNLPQTLLGLIDEAPAGRTAGELEEILHLANVKPALSRLAAQGRVERVKVGGAMVYLARRRTRRQQQLRRREAQAAEGRRRRPLPDPQSVIALLVEMIRRPRQTPRQWARRLARQGIRLGARDIAAVIDHYGLSLKNR